MNEDICDNCIHFWPCEIYNRFAKILDKYIFLKDTNMTAYQFLPTICKYYNKNAALHGQDEK